MCYSLDVESTYRINNTKECGTKMVNVEIAYENKFLENALVNQNKLKIQADVIDTWSKGQTGVTRKGW